MFNYISVEIFDNINENFQKTVSKEVITRVFLINN